MSEASDLLAVDVGTSRVKFGWFPAGDACTTAVPVSPLAITSPQLPEPSETFACRHRDVQSASLITEWLSRFEAQQTQVALCSVSPETTQSITETLAQCGFSSVKVLSNTDLAIDIQVKQPNRVGIDRLLSAVAVNRVRHADRPAIVMDLGTAVTIDLISNSGAFLGGAILPGWSLSASALHGATSSLPLLNPDNLQLPEHALGKCTTEAIAAGLTWGLIGALEKLIEKYTKISATKPQHFLTGGDAPLVLDTLKNGLVASATSTSGKLLNNRKDLVRHVSHLVLIGIAIAYEENR